jgi:hypothetical protein
MRVKKTQQVSFCKTNRVEKFLQKLRPKTDVLLDFVLSRFWAFSVRGVQKHDKNKYGKTNLTLSFFRTLTHPPTTGVTVFCRPLDLF